MKKFLIYFFVVAVAMFVASLGYHTFTVNETVKLDEDTTVQRRRFRKSKDKEALKK